MRNGILYALLAAFLFGASTPFSKTMVGQVAPVALAGLLYLGSGAGLLVWFILRAIGPRAVSDRQARLTRADWPWLGSAILSGGIAGPALLMVGLTVTPASSASLLLNLEGVLTAILAWLVFRENVDRRIAIGMLSIFIAGVLLSWDQSAAYGMPWGALAIFGACLCWAVDNNVTRKIAASDAVQIACIKGLVAGIVNLSIAVAVGLPLPALPVAALIAVVGFGGYGLSLVLFVLALRHLGAARTGAYFSAAPFAGAVMAIVLLGEAPNLTFWIAAALMAFGIGLHLTERHLHRHAHEPLRHAHEHRHDAHHQHAHDADSNWIADGGQKSHSHEHEHVPLTHTHKHFPDIHHQHRH